MPSTWRAVLRPRRKLIGSGAVYNLELRRHSCLSFVMPPVRSPDWAAVRASGIVAALASRRYVVSKQLSAQEISFPVTFGAFAPITGAGGDPLAEERPIASVVDGGIGFFSLVDRCERDDVA